MVAVMILRFLSAEIQFSLLYYMDAIWKHWLIIHYQILYVCHIKIVMTMIRIENQTLKQMWFYAIAMNLIADFQKTQIRKTSSDSWSKTEKPCYPGKFPGGDFL